MKQKQIDELELIRRTTKQASIAHRAFAILLLVKGADMSLSIYSVDHARRLKYAYIKTGLAALEDKRKNNRDRILAKPERDLVIEALKTKKPKDVILGCEVEQWTTGLLGVYILGLTGKAYKSKTSEYLLFREAKLTFHLPGKSYENSDPKVKEDWIEDTRPILKRLWNEENTVILCEDEMVLTAKTTTQKVWLPSGEYPPVLEVNGRGKNKSFYGFLNLKTGQENTFITDWQNMYITAEILTKLREIYPTQKLVIIWDNAGWHRGIKVKEWIENDNNTETIYFPPYTPDLNPQEHVWKAGRKETSHNRYMKKIEEVADEFKEYIENNIFKYELLGFRAI